MRSLTISLVEPIRFLRLFGQCLKRMGSTPGSGIKMALFFTPPKGQKLSLRGSLSGMETSRSMVHLTSG